MSIPQKWIIGSIIGICLGIIACAESINASVPLPDKPGQMAFVMLAPEDNFSENVSICRIEPNKLNLRELARTKVAELEAVPGSTVKMISSTRAVWETSTMPHLRFIQVFVRDAKARDWMLTLTLRKDGDPAAGMKLLEQVVKGLQPEEKK